MFWVAFPAFEAQFHEFPCFFPVKQGIGARDGFAVDWFVSHLFLLSPPPLRRFWESARFRRVVAHEGG